MAEKRGCVAIDEKVRKLDLGYLVPWLRRGDKWI